MAVKTEIENAKEYLERAQKIQREIQLNKEKIKKAESFLSEKEQSCDKNQAVDNAVQLLKDYKALVNAATLRLLYMWLEIEKTIESVQDDNEREVLTRRYLLFQPIESKYDKETNNFIKGIDKEMNFSARQLYRLRDSALAKIKIPKDVSECH